MSLQKQEEGILVLINQTQVSALQDPAFTNVSAKAQQWLSNSKQTLGRDMDNVVFNEDRFELMVDTRGYRPQDVKCTVTSNSIEIVAEKQEVAGGSQRCMATTRSYQLPQLVQPQQAICCLSSEGILLVTVPWQK